MANHLYVVIATAGRAKLLNRTLQSLAACEKPSIYRRTIVVENGPQLGAESIVNQYKEKLNTQYIHVPHANKSHALNEAVRTLGTGLVFFTDDDVEIDPRTILSYAEKAEGIERGAYYGGPITVDAQSELPSWLSPLLPASATGLDVGKLEAHPDRYFLGFNWAAFAEDILDVGGFSTVIGPGSSLGATVGEESLIQKQLELAHVKRILVPSAVVRHYVPSEHYSLQWALKRQYTKGLSTGVLMEASRTVLTIPRQPLLSGIQNLGQIFWRGMRLDFPGALYALARMIRCIGQIKGYYLQRRYNTLQADPLTAYTKLSRS